MWKFTKHNLINIALAALLALVLLLALQNARGNYFPDPDGFYHAKASQLMSREGLIDRFPWTYYSTWRDSYADQHFLYHWLLTPFNTVERLPWSVIVFGAVFAAAFFSLMSAMSLKAKGFWLGAMLIGSVDFLFRINLVKANTLSLALLCIIALFTYLWHISVAPRGRAWLMVGLALVSGLFSWTYGGFVVVPLFVGAYCVAASLQAKKLVVAPVLASIIGIAIGLAVHPHSGNLWSLMYDQLFQTGLGAGSKVPAGNEWLPFDPVWFIRSNILLVVLWIASFVLSAWNFAKTRSYSWHELWFHISALGFLALALWHRRFIEYWVPFAVLVAAVTLSPYVAKITWRQFWQALKTYWQFSVVVLLVLGSFAAVVNFNIRHVIGSLRNGSTLYQYRAASGFINQRSQPEDIVFNTQWDQMPQLFYWNDKNYYLVGLDPTFMYLHNQELYWQWREIVDDTEHRWGSAAQVRDTIKNRFNAQFIFIEKDRNPNLFEFLQSSRQEFVLGYEDNIVAVFEVR